MKIQAINNNSFKGLFTDKSAQNNNEWLMEYRPYSWELNNEAEPKMAFKKQVDVRDEILPDNEEIYTKAYGSEPERSKDILGTESYYKYPNHIMNGKMRSTITVAEPLNREESLKVYLKKMKNFKIQKEQEQKILGNFSFGDIQSKYHQFESASSDYDAALIFKQEEKDRMVTATRGMFGAAEKLYKQARAYNQMTDSLKATDKKISDIEIELETINSGKKAGNLIDISVRSGEDPDAPLKEYLSGKKLKDLDNSNKILVLPAAIVTVKEILSRFRSYAEMFSRYDCYDISKQFMEEVHSKIRSAIK